MSTFLRSRAFVGTFVAVVVVHVLLGTVTFGPATSATLTGVPVAVVDLDGSAAPVPGPDPFAGLTGADGGLLAWSTLPDRVALDEALTAGTFAAGVVVPSGARDGLARIVEGSAPDAVDPIRIELHVNVGRDPQASGAVADTLAGLVAAVSDAASVDAIARLASEGRDVAPARVALLARPVVATTVPVNAPASAAAAQAPLVLVALLWIGALIATLVSWLSLHRDTMVPRTFVAAQLAVLAVLVAVQPVSILVVGRAILGLDVTVSVALVGALALTTALFFLLQSAVLNWLGFGGWPILVLLWLFSFTLLSVPTEALATGYRVLVHSWLPSRFPHDALRGILHFDGAGGATAALWTSAGITAVALVLLLASVTRLRGRDLARNPIAARLERLSPPAPERPAPQG